MQPQSPNPDFDFMLKDQQPARRGLSMPGLPRPALYGIAGVVIIILLIVVFSIFSGSKGGSTQSIIGALARGQETLRITDLVQTQLQLQDPQTKALAATVSASLNSDQSRFKSYLLSNKVKPNPKQLAADLDATTDASMRSASQSNNLDQAYKAYLQSALSKYETELKTAYQKAGPKGKELLNEASISASALLTSPQLKSVTSLTCDSAGATAC
jgi:hypothetical protein